MATATTTNSTTNTATADTNAEYVFRTNSAKLLAKQCGCSQEEAYYFRHRCKLSIVRLEFINMWLADVSISPQVALRVAFLFCFALHDPECNFLEGLDLIAETFEVDLSFLIPIYRDQRQWLLPSSGRNSPFVVGDSGNDGQHKEKLELSKCQIM